MGMLYAKRLPINDDISIIVPTVGEILDNEDKYYDVVCSIVATPYDMMVQLDDAKIDFTKITDFDLFCLLFQRLQHADTSLVFGDLDLSKLKTALNQQTGEVILLDAESGLIIDRVIHSKICSTIRTMLHMERNDKRPGNEEARRYMLKQARKKQKRLKDKQRSSQLENFIIALVNTEQFSYNYETVQGITMYQFYASLNQIAHKIKYDNTMVGYYAGTIKFDDLTTAERTWIQNV